MPVTLRDDQVACMHMHISMDIWISLCYFLSASRNERASKLLIVLSSSIVRTFAWVKLATS